MSDEVFWNLTFEEYFAREIRYMEVERRWDIRFGIIGATIVNWSGKQLQEGAPAISAESFFGYSIPKQKDDGEDYEMSPEESIAFVQKFMQPKRVA